MKQCNACGKKKDTTVTGKVRIRIEDLEVFEVTFCSGCVAKMQKGLNGPLTLPVHNERSEPTEGAWETPTWDSD